MGGTVRKGITLTEVGKWKQDILELNMTYDRDIYFMNITHIFSSKKINGLKLQRFTDLDDFCCCPLPYEKR